MKRIRTIAERLHVYRESVTSALGELGKAGIIAIRRKCIRIVDRTHLERASREERLGKGCRRGRIASDASRVSRVSETITENREVDCQTK